MFLELAVKLRMETESSPFRGPILVSRTGFLGYSRRDAPVAKARAELPRMVLLGKDSRKVAMEAGISIGVRNCSPAESSGSENGCDLFPSNPSNACVRKNAK